MKKHAYLIMAYNSPNQLKKLINLLDDERNDIFLHIDADSDFPIDDFLNITEKSKIYFVDRISVKWAHYSQIQAELNLLKAATQNANYHYYHLLSGMDLPLKTQDEIHDFFKECNDEFIATVPFEGQYQIDHVKYFYPLLRFKVFRKSLLLKAINELCVWFQKVLRINNIKDFCDMHFYDGWNWFSITDKFARYVIDNENKIEKIFRYAKAPDEMVLQTLAMNSEFKEKIHCTKDLKYGCMRFIDWQRGQPYVWQEGDFDELMNSPYLFARKFQDDTVFDMIYKSILKKQNN